MSRNHDSEQEDTADHESAAMKVLVGFIIVLSATHLLGMVPADQHTASYTLHVEDNPRVSEPENYITYQSLSPEEKDLFRQAYQSEPGIFGGDAIRAESEWSERDSAPGQTFVNVDNVEYRGQYFGISTTRSHDVVSYSNPRLALNIVRLIGALFVVIGTGESLLITWESYK